MDEKCHCGKSINECHGIKYRACCNCGAPIQFCNGFTKVGDLLQVWGGVRKPCEVREICGLCSETGHWTNEGTFMEKEDD